MRSILVNFNYRKYFREFPNSSRKKQNFDDIRNVYTQRASFSGPGLTSNDAPSGHGSNYATTYLTWNPPPLKIMPLKCLNEQMKAIILWFNQGSHRNSKTQYHDFSMIFHDQQCNFLDYLMCGLQHFNSIFTTLVDHACILK